MSLPIRPEGDPSRRPADVHGRGRVLRGAGGGSEEAEADLGRLHVASIRDILAKPPAERTQADIDHIYYDLFSNLALTQFQSLPPAIAKDACRHMGLQEMNMGEILFTEGDVGVAMYVVLQGTLTAHVNINPIVDEPEVALGSPRTRAAARASIESHLIEAEAKEDEMHSQKHSGTGPAPAVSFAVRSGGIRTGAASLSLGATLKPIPDDMGLRRSSVVSQRDARAAVIAMKHEQSQAADAAVAAAAGSAGQGGEGQGQGDAGAAGAAGAARDASAASASKGAEDESFDVVQKTLLAMSETVPNSAAAGLANYPILTHSDMRDEAHLSELLRVRGVDVTKWGKGAAKTVRHLWKEIQEQETVLVDSNPCIRLLNVARVRIGRPQDDYTLLETLQSMKDGRVRNRNKLLAEKVQYGERLDDAAVRACKEELGDVLEELRRREFDAAERLRQEANRKEDEARVALRAVVARLTTVDSLTTGLEASSLAHAASSQSGKNAPSSLAETVVATPGEGETPAMPTATDSEDDVSPTDELRQCADLPLQDALQAIDDHVSRAKAKAGSSPSSTDAVRTAMEMLDEAYGAATRAAADAHMVQVAAEEAKHTAENARLTLPTHCSVEIETLMSQSFPDLVTRYVLYDINVVIDGLPDDEFHTVELAHEEGAEPTTHNWRWTSPQEVSDILDKKKIKKPAPAPAPAPTEGAPEELSPEAAAQALVAESLAQVDAQGGTANLSLADVQASLGPTVAQLAPGQTFGELALLSSDNRRQASIVATSRQVDLIVLARHVYNRALRDYDKQLQAEKMTFLKSLPCFSTFADPALLNLAASMRRKVVPADTTLIAKGAPCVRVYWIMRGGVIIYLPARGDEDPQQVHLGAGDAFGHGAVAAEPEQTIASDVDAITSADTLVFFMDKHNFDRFFRSSPLAMGALNKMLAQSNRAAVSLPPV